MSAGTVTHYSDHIEVRTAGELTEARVALANAVADALGVTRSRIRLPRDYAVLVNDRGLALACYADDQVEHVRAGGGRTFTVRLSRGVRAWMDEKIGGNK